jgi:hypothetical protein
MTRKIKPFEDWAEIEKMQKFFWPEERIVLWLMKEGKTPSEVATIMQLSNRQLAEFEMKRAIDIARFYVKWKKTIEVFPFDRLRKEDRILINELIINRKGLDEVSKILKTSKTAVTYRVSRVKNELQGIGKDDAYSFLCHAFNKRNLRPYPSGTDTIGGLRKMALDEPWRIDVRNLILPLVGKVWYVWGGQDLWNKESVADCSGFVLEVLKKVNRLPKNVKDMTAQGLSEFFSVSTKNPKLADLVFYGGSWKDVNHVMFYFGDSVSEFPGKKTVVGMCGGNIGMTIEQAKKLGAALWVKKTPVYRSDFLGFKIVK